MNTELPRRPWTIKAQFPNEWRLIDADGNFISLSDPATLTFVEACVAACDGFEPAELTPRLLRRLVDQLRQEHAESLAAYMLTVPGGE